MNNPYEPPSATVADQPSFSRDRPWYVTGWLWLTIVASGLSALSYIFFSHAIRQQLPQIASFELILLGVASIANVVFAIAILRWKKWGVWGLLLTTSLAFAFNTWAMGVTSALSGVFGFIILVVLLNIGGERRVWPKLSNPELQP